MEQGNATRVHASSFVVGRQFRLDSQPGEQPRWVFGHELLEYTLLYVSANFDISTK